MKELKERPILFTGEMVRAILDGRKTQTRRVTGLEDVNSYFGILSGQCGLGPLGYRGLEPTDYNLKPSMKKQYKKNPGLFHWFLGLTYDEEEINPIPVKCPYGVPGDLLWVKETWDICRVEKESVPSLLYKADSTAIPVIGAFKEKISEYPHWRSSRFMPHWVTRIRLEIVKIRVQRVQDISESDAQHEGWDMSNLNLTERYDPVTMRKAIEWFHEIWDSINAKHGYGWDKNPWVWVIEFRKIN